MCVLSARPRSKRDLLREEAGRVYVGSASLTVKLPVAARGSLARRRRWFGL